jgi:hypothetical protein
LTTKCPTNLVDHVQAVRSAYEAANSPDSFVGRWRITPVPPATRTSWLRTTASPIRVFGADLADLADLRLPAEANYLQALLHSPWPLRMTQVSATGLNCSRERTLNEEVAAVGIFALIRYRRIGARGKGINAPTSPLWVERNIVVPTTIPYSLADRKYCQKVDPGQKLLQFA